MGKVFFRISLLAIFAIPFLVGSCDTDYIEIKAYGIQSDSTIIYLAYSDTVNTFTVNSFGPWWTEFEDEEARSWLTGISPDEGSRTSLVTLSPAANTWRRRSVRLIFHNDYDTDTLTVIQRAPTDYEPGTVIYYENFGANDTVPARQRISVNDYTGWGARGSGISVRTYTGVNAYIQSDVRSRDYDKEPHEVISGMNSLQLPPGGSINLPMLNTASNDSVFLTMYVAAYDGLYQPLEQDQFLIKGNTSTDDDAFMPLPLRVTASTGWQKIESEFRMASGTNFYLRIFNDGYQTLYVDDITLETGGRGTQVVGVPSPTVTTIAATKITMTSAVLGGRYTLPASLTAVRSAGIQWRHSEDQNYTETVIPDTRPNEAFTTELTGLEPGETYFYRAFTVYGDGSYRATGNDYSFTTEEEDQ